MQELVIGLGRKPAKEDDVTRIFSGYEEYPQTVASDVQDSSLTLFGPHVMTLKETSEQVSATVLRNITNQKRSVPPIYRELVKDGFYEGWMCGLASFLALKKVLQPSQNIQPGYTLEEDPQVQLFGEHPCYAAENISYQSLVNLLYRWRCLANRPERSLEALQFFTTGFQYGQQFAIFALHLRHLNMCRIFEHQLPATDRVS